MKRRMENNKGRENEMERMVGWRDKDAVPRGRQEWRKEMLRVRDRSRTEIGSCLGELISIPHCCTRKRGQRSNKAKSGVVQEKTDKAQLTTVLLICHSWRNGCLSIDLFDTWSVICWTFLSNSLISLVHSLLEPMNQPPHQTCVCACLHACVCVCVSKVN